MTSNDEKKTMPPFNMLPGGVSPDEIAAIKKRVRGENMSRLKIGIAVGSVVLVILAVVGGTLLGLHLSRKPNVVVRSVQLTVEDEIIEETVEVDKKKDTETFRTVSSTGTSFVIRDMKKSLSAYKFDGNEKCYIIEESLEEAENTTELLEDLEQMEEGEVDAAELLPETFLSADENRGEVERSVLSGNMLEFCEGLKTHWAVKSLTKPTPEATEEDEEEEDDPDLEMEVYSGTNGTTAVQQREKRRVIEHPYTCYWRTQKSCCRVCREVCSKRRRRGLLEGEPEQKVKKRTKRGWFINFRPVVDAVVRVICRIFCRWVCEVIRIWYCLTRG